MEKNKELPIIEEKLINFSGRCKDYDEECNQVEDPLHCFMGSDITYPSPAHGYCPLIHKEN